MAKNSTVKAAVALVSPRGTRVSVAAGKADAFKARGYKAPGESASSESEDGAPAGNASRDAWAEYAEGLGIEVPEDAKRDDVKALVEQHEND